MRVEIKSNKSTNHRAGNNGKTYGEQQAALHTGGDFPLPFKVNVEVGHEKPAGWYRLSPSSFGTDKFGNLVLGRLSLEQEPATAAKAA
ncbi:hypothetical protein J2X06_002940 [Lysobacter niastensis]|uniref:Single-stranded DNA-binding protein n=1 Tax=Lysobacter niastensis TaxID=380629 RepID=A0ABU1WEC8_9GAMM|nr:single-stranded DNA-binding protein [Lysobacter niastensis]MDR7135722.1 hypothetical protein [Lysobacter niastensis]